MNTHGPVIRYDTDKYIQYNAPSPSDRAKKVLELQVLRTLLAPVPMAVHPRPRSLDVGCATGRYPRWFEEAGYDAYGYDIEMDAVHLSTVSTAHTPHITIAHRNILEIPPEPERYAVITSMMGTLNHIPLVDQPRFLSWIYESLMPGGTVYVSVWNPECPYTSFLSFYEEAENRFLDQHSLPAAAHARLFEDAGFHVEAIAPCCFLPDPCYTAWMNEITDRVLVTLDQYLSGQLDIRNAQMYVIHARKP